jgi:hypothetical protein
MGRNLADEEHATRVAVPAVLDDGHVDVDDVAFFERLVVGDAVTDHVVDRRANALGVWLVAVGGVVERRGHGLLHVHDVVVCQPIELVGGDAGANVRGQIVEHLRGQPSGESHAFDAGGIFDGDGHVVK